MVVFDPVSALFSILPQFWLPLIPLSIFLALIIFFSDKKKHNIDGRAKYDIFVNSSLMFLVLIFTAGLLLTTMLLILPIAQIDLGSWVLFAGYLLLCLLVLHDKLGSRLTKNKFYIIFVKFLVVIYLICLIAPLAFGCFSLLRFCLGFLPTHIQFVFSYPLLVSFIIFSTLFLIGLTLHISSQLEKKYVLKQAFKLSSFFSLKFIQPLVVLLCLMIICLFLLNGEYSRRTIVESAIFSGNLHSDGYDSVYIETTYLFNLTRSGFKEDMPLEFSFPSERSTDSAIQNYSPNVSWINRSVLEKNGLSIKATRNATISDYLNYSVPNIEQQENETSIHLHFNFTGLNVSSTSISFYNLHCSNLSVDAHTILPEYVDYSDNGNSLRINMHTGSPANRFSVNQYWIVYENASSSISFGFSVYYHEDIDMVIHCLK